VSLPEGHLWCVSSRSHSKVDQVLFDRWISDSNPTLPALMEESNEGNNLKELWDFRTPAPVVAYGLIAWHRSHDVAADLAGNCDNGILIFTPKSVMCGSDLGM
jgi:hypothetical protein